MSTPEWSPVKVRGGGAPAGAPGGPPAAGANVSARGVQGWAGKNKVALGAGAVGVVVVLALLTRNKGSDQTTPAATGTTVSGTTAGQSVGAYDSSASDVYNALQPEVAALRDLIENWQSTQVPVPAGASSDVTKPVTTTPTPTTVPVNPNSVTYFGQDYAEYTKAYNSGQVAGAKAATAAEQAANRAAYEAALAKIKAAQK